MQSILSIVEKFGFVQIGYSAHVIEYCMNLIFMSVQHCQGMVVSQRLPEALCCVLEQNPYPLLSTGSTIENRNSS